MSKYIQSNKALVNRIINGFQVTAHTVTHDHSWFYHMAILKDGREVWADSVCFNDRKGERTFWSASSSCQYTSARRLVLDVAGKIIHEFETEQRRVQ